MTESQATADPAQLVTELRAENARLQRVIQLKDEQIRLLNFRFFGPKGEKLSPAQTALLFEEASVSAPEVDKEAQRPAAQKQRPCPRPKSPAQASGPGTLPAHLERREVVLPCHPEDCHCAMCGAERPVIGYDTREELACEPAKFYVKVIKREKRGSHCLPEQGVATAPVPAQIVPKSKLANEFIIELVVQKYQQHQPIYRQQADLADNHRIELSRKTLTDAVLAAGEPVAGGGGRAEARVVGRRLSASRRDAGALPDGGKDRPQPQGVHVGIQCAGRHRGL